MERSAWTDERLDDRFDHIDSELMALRTEMRQGFAQLAGGLDAQGNELRGEIADLTASLRGEITDLRSTMLRLYGGNLLAMFGLIVAVLIRGA